jgi:hypothetical protein
MIPTLVNKPNDQRKFEVKVGEHSILPANLSEVVYSIGVGDGGSLKLEINKPIVDFTVGDYHVETVKPWENYQTVKITNLKTGKAVNGVQYLYFDEKSLTLDCVETWQIHDYKDDEERVYTIEVKL